ncbi:ArsR/SmtB family transcription factor [Phaeovulum sp.]|uniref:ArsR/SmtB family transcription factor n=1 Tax=Phaeovulum sp. TaxID=2934796 RepID=UPI002730C6AA|nr:metalloregulator ArsR/SmtB family transcription factor [Phaeovulum sp.]MDP1670422.1 metalloregulator ArsR/SmtB family transcription factor [Phaeovulum sp.]MDZ4120625.1 metalloregulator ArsR/SmtB family transcription factor [Phaeovulum sp.]
MSTSTKRDLIEEYALVARALGAPHRLLLLEQLAQGERSVEVLASKVGMSVANSSQHLQQLRRAGLVTNRRDGKSVIYRLSDDETLVLMDLLQKHARRNLARVSEILRGLSGGDEAVEPISRAELAQRIAAGSVTLLDMRPADEYRMAHIPGARNAAVNALVRLAGAGEQQGEIIAYCRGPYCIEALQAVAVLRDLGISARRMEGGLPEWRAEGREVVASDIE